MSDNYSTESNYSCGLPPDFPPSFGIPPAVSYIQAGITLVIGIIGLLLNIFILFITIKYRSLHRTMYIAIQIVCGEITYSLLVPPAIFVSGIARDWLLGDAMCIILGAVNDGFAYFRFMMTFILTLDRFISVLFPFFYERHSKKISLILLSLVYLTTIIRALIPIEGLLGCYVYVGANKICTAYPGCSLGCYYLVVLTFILTIFCGAVLSFFMYMIIFCKAFKIRRAQRRIVPQEVVPPEAAPESQGESDSKPHVKPKAPKKEFHVTITIFILLMSVIGCTSPAIFLYAVQSFVNPRHGAFFIVVMLVGRTSFNSIPVVDAIAILRNKEFRETVKKLIRSIRSIRERL